MNPDSKIALEPAKSSPALPQAVTAPLTRAAIFLVVTLNAGSDHRATLLSFCSPLFDNAVFHSEFVPKGVVGSLDENIEAVGAPRNRARR